MALHPHSPLTCPAYEFVFQAAAFFQQRGLRDRCRITFITYEDDPYSVGGTQAVNIARRWLDQAGIRVLTSTFIEQVTPTGVVLGDGYELPASLLVALPAYQGPAFLKEVPYLTDADGFVITDQAMRSRAYVNIFAAGDCVAFPGPKTGYMAEQQARVAVANIAADLGLAQPADYRSVLACLSTSARPGAVVHPDARPTARARSHPLLPCGALAPLGKTGSRALFARFPAAAREQAA